MNFFFGAATSSSGKSKEKTGGNVYYLDAAMEDGSPALPALKVSAGAKVG
jgi:hypothetical protein